ncbi:SDR family NAD(P)-dependent oxidoreductase [Pseudomonas sp. GB2N2]
MSIWEERARLCGKVAVVVGGADGMGRGISLALAEAGVKLAICDIDEQALDETRRLLKPFQPDVLTQQVDVQQRGALVTFWQNVDLHFQHIDILVNVVGGVRHKAFLDSQPDDWDEVYNLNFGYVVNSCQEAARRMSAAQRPGSIINLTTIEGSRAAPGFSVYAGLKAGVSNFSRSLAVELAPHGIRINCVAPDQTPTPGLIRCVDPTSYDPPPADLNLAQIMALVEEQARNAIPMGRMGRVEDIENAVLYLASDLSSYLTGQTLHVDGGAMASAGWLKFPALGFRNRVPLKILAGDDYSADQV